MISITRRYLLAVTLACSSVLMASASYADKIKVAAIYTLPVEQQWISRIHKALNTAASRGDIEYVYSENIANTDYERVMREYAEQGMQLIVGEVFGLERAARKVAKDYPDTAFLMGSSFTPVAPNFSVFDNWIHEPSYLSGMVAGAVQTADRLFGVQTFTTPVVVTSSSSVFTISFGVNQASSMWMSEDGGLPANEYQVYAIGSGPFSTFMTVE